MQPLKVAIVHPMLGRGGSESRAMWGIEALKHNYDVSLITVGDFNLQELNKFYGTHIKTNEVTFRRPAFPGWLRQMSFGSAFRLDLLQRYVRRIAHGYHVLISAYNLCDFGRPGIHFIADFTWEKRQRSQNNLLQAGNDRVFLLKRVARLMYLQASTLARRASERDLFSGEDVIVANSNWSAIVVNGLYKITPEVVYPPVQDIHIPVNIEEKEFGVVCISRIDPAKKIEMIIEIVEGVRQKGHNLHLHIIGDTGSGKYGKMIENRAAIAGGWVHLEGERSGAEKERLLADHMIGINARDNEAFGISVAEMVKAACLTFVPETGGQAEIVDHPGLIYNDVADAVAKICRTLEDIKYRKQLQEHLLKQGKLFSTHRFMQSFKSVIDRFV